MEFALYKLLLLLLKNPNWSYYYQNKEKLVHAGVYPLSIRDHYLVYAVRKIGIPRGRPKFVES